MQNQCKDRQAGRPALPPWEQTGGLFGAASTETIGWQMQHSRVKGTQAPGPCTPHLLLPPPPPPQFQSCGRVLEDAPGTWHSSKRAMGGVPHAPCFHDFCDGFREHTNLAGQAGTAGQSQGTHWPPAPPLHPDTTTLQEPQALGRQRNATHSTFLRDTFWLGRVAETVM